MKTFTDSAGHTWTVAITVDAIKRVQGLVGINLARITEPIKPNEPPLLTVLETDLMLLVDTIYAIVQPQAETAGITGAQFGAALGGDAISAAHDAFWAKLADFFRGLRRMDHARAIEKQLAMVQTAARAADRRIEQIDVDAIVESTLGSSASSSPAPSVSIPAL